MSEKKKIVDLEKFTGEGKDVVFMEFVKSFDGRADIIDPKQGRIGAIRKKLNQIIEEAPRLTDLFK